MYVYTGERGGGRRRNGHGYPSLSPSLPTSSLWTALGGGGVLEEGKVLSKTQSLSSFGQWLTESRDPLESFSASRGTKVVSGARKTDGTVNLREGWGSVCVCVIWGSSGLDAMWEFLLSLS